MEICVKNKVASKKSEKSPKVWSKKVSGRRQITWKNMDLKFLWREFALKVLVHWFQKDSKQQSYQ